MYLTNALSPKYPIYYTGLQITRHTALTNKAENNFKPLPKQYSILLKKYKLISLCLLWSSYSSFIYICTFELIVQDFRGRLQVGSRELLSLIILSLDKVTMSEGLIIMIVLYVSEKYCYLFVRKQRSSTRQKRLGSKTF